MASKKTIYSDSMASASERRLFRTFWKNVPSRIHLNVVLVCYLLEITTFVRVSNSHQLAPTSEGNLHNVTEPLTWKVLLSFRVESISEKDENVFQEIKNDSEQSSKRNAQISKAIISKLVAFICNQHSPFTWDQIKIQGIGIVPLNETEGRLQVLFGLYFQRNYNLGESMGKFIGYLNDPKDELVHQFSIKKTIFTYIPDGVIEGNSAYCEFMKVREENGTLLKLQGRYIENVGKAPNCPRIHALPISIEEKEKHIDLPWAYNAVIELGVNHSWSARHRWRLLKTAIICLLCSSSIVFILWIFVFKLNPLTELSMRNRRINPHSDYVTRKLSSLVGKVDAADGMDDSLVMQNVLEEENAEAAPEIEEEAIVIDMDFSSDKESHVGLEVLEDEFEEENAEIAPDIEEEAIFIDID